MKPNFQKKVIFRFIRFMKKVQFKKILKQNKVAIYKNKNMYKLEIQKKKMFTKILNFKNLVIILRILQLYHNTAARVTSCSIQLT